MFQEHSKELHRSEHEFLYSIGPQRRGFEEEPFADYFGRISCRLPNVPREVAEQWLHRHYPHGVLEYDWVGIRGLTFRLETWSAGRVLEEVALHPGDDLVAKHERLLKEDSEVRQSWLGERMLQHKTWPVAPIILENFIDLRFPSGVLLGRPYHLMEGHHRLGYFRAIHKNAFDSSTHEIWIASPDPSQIMSFYPANDLDPCCEEVT